MTIDRISCVRTRGVVDSWGFVVHGLFVDLKVYRIALWRKWNWHEILMCCNGLLLNYTASPHWICLYHIYCQLYLFYFILFIAGCSMRFLKTINLPHGTMDLTVVCGTEECKYLVTNTVRWLTVSHLNWENVFSWYIVYKIHIYMGGIS